jgi:predicted AlkP superfamily pyrophosphatase or phosphodiesterase
MIKNVSTLVLAAFYTGCGSMSVRPAQVTQPKLAVVIIVDQLPQYLLNEYDDVFTGGLRRLRDEGHYYVNASHKHAVTKTAVGHATLATGVFANRHGITGNEWYELVAGKWVQVSNVGDSTERIIDHPTFSGVSPHYLMHSALPDWLVAADSNSIVASVSGKDRGAVLPAGHSRGFVYWLDSIPGRFVTSTYYRNANPAWVTRFNEQELPKFAKSDVWASTVTVSQAPRTSPDTAAWENDGHVSYFPHRFAVEGRPSGFWGWASRTPLLDSATLAFAKTMVRELHLGSDATPDYLNISLTATDRIGHDFGPRSREQLDNLKKLDKQLGIFFDFLDATVGRGNWVAGLSSDHGALDAPESVRARGGNAQRATQAQQAALAAIKADANLHANDPETPRRVVAALKALDFVRDAWVEEDLLHSQPADSFAVLAKRSLYAGRAASDFSRQGVAVRYAEGFLNRAYGTDHGAPYWYDRNVPIVFIGAGVEPGVDSEFVGTVDFAPTLAALLHVSAPADLDGRVLSKSIR